MDAQESSAPNAHPSTEEQDHPHACLNGYVYLGYSAVDEETGEEVERVEALPCRRCAKEARSGNLACISFGVSRPPTLEDEWTSISRRLTITKCRVI